MKEFYRYPTLQSFANALARQQGYGRATKVELGPENRVTEQVRPGYRKHTTGEYVPNKYRSNFGWKNTYYQAAETTVTVLPEIIVYFKVKGVP